MASGDLELIRGPREILGRVYDRLTEQERVSSNSQRHTLRLGVTLRVEQLLPDPLRLLALRFIPETGEDRSRCRDPSLGLLGALMARLFSAEERVSLREQSRSMMPFSVAIRDRIWSVTRSEAPARTSSS